MSSKPLVSAIVIFLNAEKFIQEAIESVFAQTYDNWELLLVDDGSTDGSTEIALRYAQQNPGKVRYLEHEGHQNLGMSATRNKGICNAKGKYIDFLDADDVWLPHKLEQQVAILDSQPEAAMVYGPIQWWYSWTGNPQDRQRDFVQEIGVQPNTLLKPSTLLTVFLQNSDATPCAPLMRREVIERIGGFEEAFRGMYEDQVFRTKICVEAPIFVSSECWYRYRQHPNNCCSVAVNTGQYHSARLTFLNWLEKYLSEQGVKNSEVWKVLQKQLWSYRHPILYRLSGCVQRLIKQMKGLVKLTARQTLPVPIRHWLRAQWRGQEYFAPFLLRFGSLRRMTPISRRWGFDRGLPIDRYYIEQFLSTQVPDIQGHVLEVADNTYTRQFGGDRVVKSDVLYVKEGNPKATIMADLTSAEHILSDTFDSIILTQTLQFIYDVPAALKTLYRILKPGGVLLVTFPGISKISREDMDSWGEYWRFTTLSSRRLFEEVFPSEQLTVGAYGNVFAALTFLHGLAAEELRQEELDYCDPNYEVLIAVRAVKPEVT